MKTLTRTRGPVAAMMFGLNACIIAGCMRPTTAPVQTAPGPKVEADDLNAPPESNIVRVNKFFNSNPWLSFEGDGNDDINGVRFALYLEGPDHPHGVFGTGTIVVTMYRLDETDDCKEAATQVYEWKLPPHDAYPWRAKKKTALGWGYGLRLHWDKNIEVRGKSVAFVVKYVRDDGKVIASSRQVLKVPGRGKTGVLG